MNIRNVSYNKRVTNKIRSERSPLLWDGENRLKIRSIE
jgi:hypothetical protein